MSKPKPILAAAVEVGQLDIKSAGRLPWSLEPLDYRKDGDRKGERMYFPSIRVKSDKNPLYGRIVINEGVGETQAGEGLEPFDNLARYVVSAVSHAPALAEFVRRVDEITREPGNAQWCIAMADMRRRLGLPPKEGA